jgi:putative ABC transport system permease protein
MFANYLKIAWRNILNKPLFSVINVVGLAIGLACCIMITLFVRYETSFDKQWYAADRVYRVTRDFYSNNLRLAAVAPPIAPLLQQDFPEIEDTVRILRTGPVAVTRDDQQVRELNMVIADPNLFSFFGIELTAGNPETALADPGTLVISERAAARYFGNEDPIGRQLTIAGRMPVTVSGTFRDLPENTHMAFELAGSMLAVPNIMGPNALQSWGSNNYYTYIRLPAATDPAALAARFPDFLIKHLGERAPDGTGLQLQKLTDIHLYSNRDSEWRANGSIAAVYTFSAVALVVLAIACINFMNLTTARSTQRAREVGVRKVVGATRQQLIVQFLSESTLLTALAMLLALAIVELTLPFFAAFIEAPLSLPLHDPQALALLLGGLLVVGLVAGSYPAFYLSNFRPAEVLKGGVAAGGSALLRKLLVVFQFATSIALLIATGVVIAQMQYARNMDVGYDRSQNLISQIPYFADMWGTYEPMKAELEAHPGIESVVLSSRVPGMQNLDGSGYISADVQFSRENSLGLSDIMVDYQWFDHYGIEFLAGRPFRENERRIEEPTADNPHTTGAIILNESAARRLGWTTQEAVGKHILDLRGNDGEMFVDREVIGVIPDIHFSSLHDAIKATVYVELSERRGRYVSIKLAPGDPSAAIEHFESVWKRLLPGEPPFWEFLDSRFDALYRAEARQAQMFALFSGFAILVATLGLFGLASFTAERRTKEIGVRKVMGATVRDIILLLTADFTRLVIIANLLAWPVAFYFMRDWLTRFAYQAPFAEWAWLFVASGAAALIVAWLTIAAQAGKAARARPVLALRYE